MSLNIFVVRMMYDSTRAQLNLPKQNLVAFTKKLDLAVQQLTIARLT